jgi:hypothetical protein
LALLTPYKKYFMQNMAPINHRQLSLHKENFSLFSNTRGLITRVNDSLQNLEKSIDKDYIDLKSLVLNELDRLV